MKLGTALAFLLFCATASPAADPDPALLQRLEQLRIAVRQSAPELWPGWDAAQTPIGIYKGNEMGVLIGHPSPPAGFRRFETPLVSAPVYVADSTAGMVRANTAQVFAGVLTSFFSYQEFMEKTPAGAVALGLHELFHAHYTRIAPKKYGDILVVLFGRYPEFSARNRALLALEGEMLLRAATAEDAAAARRDGTGFLGIRQERRSDLGADIARYERGEEASEGIARYIEYRFLLKQAPPEAAKRLEPLKSINTLERDRERFYALGMAQALVLDQVRPGWKKEFETGPMLLDEMLTASVPAPPAAETRALLEKLDYRDAFRQQEKALAPKQEEGTKRLMGLLAGTNERVVAEVAGVKNSIQLRGFNPNGSIALSPDHVAHTFLVLELGSEPGATMRFDFRATPIVYDKVQDAFWFLVPPEVLKKALGQFIESAESRRLSLKAPGLAAEFSGVEVERRSRELRVRPARDLKRAPELKKPEFVRPE